jgi:hypothetical protein
MNSNVLSTLRISTGNSTVVSRYDFGVNSTSGAAAAMPALGYNPLDGYLYGSINNAVWPQPLVRLSFDGTYQTVTTLGGSQSLPTRFLVGDVDSNGQFWAGATLSGQFYWSQINLDPRTPNYGSVVNSGVTAAPAYALYDWAFVPGGGNTLYTIGMQGYVGNGPYQYIPYLMGFDLGNKTWRYIADGYNTTFPTTVLATNALYSGSDGFLYGSNAGTGEIYRYNITSSDTPPLVATGPASNVADGARCINYIGPV